jgi:hypothetical protein
VARLVFFTIFVGIVAGYLAGGRLRHVVSLRLRWTGLLWAALLLQVVSDFAPALRDDIEGTLRFSVLIPVYLLASGWLLINLQGRRRLLQLALLAVLIGGGLNGVTMALNGGMPHRVEAEAAAGITAADRTHAAASPKHNLDDSDVRLSWLGDVVPVRPVRLLISAGDVAILLGIAGIVAAAMRGQHQRRRWAPTARLSRPQLTGGGDS